MATCPTCRKTYPNTVSVCTEDGQGLLPDEAFSGADMDLAAGRKVGEYEIQAKIGEGGFGSVYRAMHPLIGKAAAIKVLNRQYSSNPQMVSRFISEARAVNRIRHRHIIDIFSFGTLEDGRQYFVMELLEGMPLDAFLKSKGRLSVEETIAVLRPVARALDAAHAAGIAHRDLKPENVFCVFEEDGSIFPKLLDFGIAKLMQDAAGSGGGAAGPRTRTGTPMGTPYYMSPEQCRGKDVDQRTDIYSFGVMCHELLTGTLPFQGEDMIDLLVKQTSAPAPPMSTVCPGVPGLGRGALDAPVLHMLEKDPARRPPTVSSALEALAAAARDAGYDVKVLPVVSRGTPNFERPSGAELAGFVEARTVAGTPALSGPPGAMTPGAMTPGNMTPGNTPRLQTFQGATADAPVPPRRRLGLILGVSLGVPLVLIAVVMGLGTRRGRPPVPATPEPPVALAPQPSGGAPSASAVMAVVAPLEETVALTLQTTPQLATVLLDGKQVGTTASPIQLPRGNQPVILVVKADGYAPEKVKVVPDKSMTVTGVKLARAAARPTGGKQPQKPQGVSSEIEPPTF